MIAQLLSLLDDGATGELGLCGDVKGVWILAEQLCQLGPEVGDVRCVSLLAYHLTAPLLELYNGGAPYTLGVVGCLSDGSQPSDPISPEHVPCVDTQLGVIERGAEDVVSGLGDVRVGCQSREEDDAFSLGQGRDAKHRTAAGCPEDDLHFIHVG